MHIVLDCPAVPVRPNPCARGTHTPHSHFVLTRSSVAFHWNLAFALRGNSSRSLQQEARGLWLRSDLSTVLNAARQRAIDRDSDRQMGVERC